MRTNSVDDNPAMHSNMGMEAGIPPQIRAVKETIIDRLPLSHVAFESNKVTHPHCLPVQPSLTMDSSMPRVPTKAAVIAVDDNGDDERSFDDRLETISQHLVTTSEQFEDIPRRHQRTPDHASLLKVGALHFTAYDHKQTNHLPFLLLARFNGIRQ